MWEAFVCSHSSVLHENTMWQMFPCFFIGPAAFSKYPCLKLSEVSPLLWKNRAHCVKTKPTKPLHQPSTPICQPICLEELILLGHADPFDKLDKPRSSIDQHRSNHRSNFSQITNICPTYPEDDSDLGVHPFQLLNAYFNKQKHNAEHHYSTSPMAPPRYTPSPGATRDPRFVGQIHQPQVGTHGIETHEEQGWYGVELWELRDLGKDGE